MKRSKEELLPCPFCGNKDIYVTDTLSVDGYFTGRCNRCNATGNFCEDIVDAIQAWNTRPYSGEGDVFKEIKGIIHSYVDLLVNYHGWTRDKKTNLLNKGDFLLGKLQAQLAEREKEIEGFLLAQKEMYEKIKNDYIEICAKHEELKSKHAWIPVSERLPDDTQETYLIYNEYQGDYYYGVFIGDYDADRKSWWDMTGDKVEVTHWMPLPEPPASEVKG